MRAELGNRLLQLLGVVLQPGHHSAAHPAHRVDLATQACHIFCQHAFSSFYLFPLLLDSPSRRDPERGPPTGDGASCCNPVIILPRALRIALISPHRRVISSVSMLSAPFISFRYSWIPPAGER